MRGVWGALLSMTALVYADTEPFRPKVIFNRECHVGNGSTHLLIQPSFPSSGRGWIMSLMYHVSSSLEGPGTMAGTCVVEKRMIRVDFFSITGRHILQAVKFCRQTYFAGSQLYCSQTARQPASQPNHKNRGDHRDNLSCFPLNA
jgi:hypothetical protein